MGWPFWKPRSASTVFTLSVLPTPTKNHEKKIESNLEQQLERSEKQTACSCSCSCSPRSYGSIRAAPGRWLTAYSSSGRTSNTMAFDWQFHLSEMILAGDRHGRPITLPIWHIHIRRRTTLKLAIKEQFKVCYASQIIYSRSFCYCKKADLVTSIA